MAMFFEYSIFNVSTNITVSQVQLMKLKMRAIVLGSQSLLAEERCYLLVLLPLGHNISSVAVCMSSAWSVGRALDAIADVAKVSTKD